MIDYEKYPLVWTLSSENISGFSPGGYLETSEQISFDTKYRWKVRFYPSGRYDKFQDYVTLAIVFQNASEEPKFFKGSISLLGGSKEDLIKSGWCPSKFPISFIDDTFLKKRILFSKKYRGLVTIEIVVFLKTNDIEQSSFVQSSEMPMPMQSTNQQEIFSKCAKYLPLGVAEFSFLSKHVNATFYSGHHEFVQIPRSPNYFADRFQKDLMDKEKLSKFDSLTLKSLADFLLQDQVKIPDFETAFDLFKAGGKFQISELKTYCASYLGRHLTTKNVYQVLQLNEEDSTKDLKTSACKFIVDNFGEFQKSEVDMYNLTTKLDPLLLTSIFMELSRNYPSKK